MYPLPILDKTMEQLEGLQYETELYINIGYYTIWISPTRQKMTTIVTEFGKFRCNHLPMYMWASGHIFQYKLDKLRGDIKGIKTYIDDILLLSKN